MNRFNALKWPLAAALLSLATLVAAERSPATVGFTPVIERRGEPVAAPVRTNSNGAQAAARIDDAGDTKRPDWLMILAGLAVAGWIAQRRLASPLE